MIFSIQRFLEDYFSSRSLLDKDQYAVNIANVYDRKRSSVSDDHLLQLMRRIRTVFYKNNPSLTRSAFEKRILQLLDSKFKKKISSSPSSFPGGVIVEKAKLAGRSRRTLRETLESFKLATEARAIDSFWLSRKSGKLRSRPEEIAQSLLALFMKGVFENKSGGYVFREFQSGIGFVDFGIIFSRTLHLVEMKVITQAFKGRLQLQQYMKSEQKREGWLLLFDARAANKKTVTPGAINTSDGIIRVLVVDINPVPPSKQS